MKANILSNLGFNMWGGGGGGGEEIGASDEGTPLDQHNQATRES